MSRFPAAIVVLAGLLAGLPYVARAAEPLFDPRRHMRVDEVRPGMKGYGLSVFRGTRIERFDVEVVSVLRNYNPRRHVVLIRCSGQNLEHTGAVQGMSGSPVFLRDDAGQERMIGAFAYGWALAKDPIAGVQPIEYMLAMGDRPRPPAGPTTEPSARVGGRQPYDVLAAMRRLSATSADFDESDRATDDAGSLRRLSTPVTAGGFSPGLIRQFQPQFARAGMILLRGGAAGGDDASAAAEIEPGSVVVTPLLVGDADIHANGTCTEVLGDRVFAFGHPFNNEGSVSIPFAAGAVNAVVAQLDSSFKIASMGPVRGELYSDETVGVAGRLGQGPDMVPVQVRVRRPGESEPVEYNFRAVRHPRFLPIVAAMAMNAALLGDSELPQYNSVGYDVRITFDNGRTVRFRNLDANVNPQELLFNLVMPLSAAAENPFQRVMPTRIEGDLRVTAEPRLAQIHTVQLPKTRFRPGDRIDAFVSYRPFRGDEAHLPVSIELPRDLPDGSYSLVIGDWSRHLRDEATAKPFRFTAENVEQVFDILQDVAGVRRDAIYARLLRQPDGVAVGRSAMDLLPSSRRQVLLGAGRSNVTAFVSSSVQVIPTDLVMTGSAEFTIQVERRTRVETVAPTASPTSKPAG